MSEIIPINSMLLTPGMVLAKDLIINGVKILPKDNLLDKNSIEKIHLLYSYSDVYIYQNPDENLLEIEKQKTSAAYQRTFENFTKFATEAKLIFDTVSESSKVDMNQIRSLSDGLTSELKNTGIVIKNIIDAKQVDSYLFRHSVNVAVLCALMAKWLDLSKQDSLLLTYAGLLHDIGKSKIHEDILHKPDKLTNKEMETMKTHAVKSYEIIKEIKFLDSRVDLAVLLHHERLDGSGYPLKLKDEKIPLFARILAIADVFDAITSNRCYKKKESPLKALEILKEESFDKLDFKLTNMFIDNLINYYNGSYVFLSNNTTGKIIKMDPFDLTHPLVMIGLDVIDLKNKPDIKVLDLV